MSSHSVSYAEHIKVLQARTLEAIQRESIDGLIIHSGQGKMMFLDDNYYPYKVNPHFKAWLPIVDNPCCWLVVNGVDKPKLIFFKPEDFWHKVPPKPTDFWVEHFDIVYLKQAKAVEKHLPYDKVKYAYVGEYIEVAKALGFEIINPDRVLNYLHWQRAYKTDYEMECMRQANVIAVGAHRAAKAAFFDAKSEFDINSAYLRAARQGHNDLPYNNIVALNENAAILHYMQTNNHAPTDFRTFLIDAGASYHGYAADITRTYCAKSHAFADMIKTLDSLCIKLGEKMKPGLSYVDIQLAAHAGIAQILQDYGIVNLSAQDCVEQQITKTFFPHGVGHFLGLQVHDVGGHAGDDRGTPNSPPDEHPFLRCTRTIEAKQVFTIEPGLYFIDSLLSKLKGSEQSKYINWDVVDDFRPYGGIRIEDNIIVHRERNENMTRELGLGSD